MKSKILIFLFCAITIGTTNGQQQDNKEKLICEAVQQQMNRYPASTLKDIYKNFFQDYFGPGHIISDTTVSGKYLRAELLQCQNDNDVYFETVGYLGNYYRVSLSVVTEKMISYELLFRSLINSANQQQPMLISDWKNEWQLIDGVIASMNLNLTDYQSDRNAIFELLAEDKYVMHHSAIFNKTYQPHYRIIAKDIFERDLLPLIKQQ